MNRRALFLCLATLALAIAAGTAAQGNCYPDSIAYASGPMNIRQSHSIDSPVVRRAAAGDSFPVSSSTQGSAYCWLNIPSGWMARTARISASPPGGTTAPAVNHTTRPSNIDNCCFLDRQCLSDQEWVDGYWAFQNGQCATPAQSQQETSAQPAGSEPSQIDNCCFVNRQCNTNQEWLNGYWAYQSNQCNAPVQSRSGGGDNCCLTGWNCVGDRDWANGQWAYANNVCVHPSPHNTRPGEGPSCCFHGWNCTFDFDWLEGRFHYERHGGQCGSPIQEIFNGVILEGSPTFIAKVKSALALLERRAPEWYAYTITATRKIRERPSGASSPLQHSINLSNDHLASGAAGAAGTIVHESCHQQRWLVWVWREYEVEWTAEEAVCDTVANMARRQIHPGSRGFQVRINEFLSLGLDFDLDASVNREWERAKLILSRLR